MSWASCPWYASSVSRTPARGLEGGAGPSQHGAVRRRQDLQVGEGPGAALGGQDGLHFFPGRLRRGEELADNRPPLFETATFHLGDWGQWQGAGAGKLRW